MTRISSIKESTVDGTEGFIIEWEMIGFAKPMAKFRARGMTALRFPTTITRVDIVGVREFGGNDFAVQVFIPTEGFLSAGIENPVNWLREQFGDKLIRG